MLIQETTKMARPRFRPSDEQRRLVKTLAAFGINQQKIARRVDVSHKTLTKHFRDELEHGSIEAEAEVAKSLFQMARSGKNLAATIYFLKTKGWWPSPGSETRQEPVADFVVVIDKKAA
jgi:DNA-binding XRE family transcriptional regulator